MSDSLAVAALAGLGGMVGWGFADFFAKKTIDRLGEVRALFWAQVFGLIPLLAIFAAVGEVPARQGSDSLWLVLLGLGCAATYLVLYAGFRKGSISVLSPVLGSEAAFTVLFSVVVLGERIPASQWLAITVVLVGVVAISTPARDVAAVVRTAGTSATRGLPQVVVGAVGFGVWIALLDRFIGTRDWLFFLIVIRAVAALTVAAYAGATKQTLRLPLGERSVWAGAAAVGIFDTAAFAAVSYGLSATTHTSVIAVMSATFALPTMLLARVFLRERIARSQAVAAGIILLGVALVSV